MKKLKYLFLILIFLFLTGCKDNKTIPVDNEKENDNKTEEKIDDDPIEHICEHICSICGKCTDPLCQDPKCSEKCLGHEKEKVYYTITFMDYDDSIIESNHYEEGTEINYPEIPTRSHYEFIGWSIENLEVADNNYEIKALYELTDPNYNITYVLDDHSIIYESKDEMVKSFLHDFYLFVNPTETECTFFYGPTGTDYTTGFWINYLGGNESNNNRLICNNDIDADDEYYFFNSKAYKDKWYMLSSYVKNYICKGNKRFGYPENEYLYGALDFKRYIIGDPATYIKTYGGEEIFYGFPSNDNYLINSYDCTTDTFLNSPYNSLFDGWYKDQNYKDGPHDVILKDTEGDITFYAKWRETDNYEISFINCENVEVIIASKGDEIILPTPTLDGATFMGWYLDYRKMPQTFTYVYDVSLKLTAKWHYDGVINTNELIYDGEVIRYRNTAIAVEIPETYVEKDTELRAVWVSSMINNFTPSTDPVIMMANLTEVLDLVEYYNMNAIMFHLRTHNNAYYKTKLAPIKKEYGTYELFEEWDYLPWFINECHKRGIECHAWLNPYRIALDGIVDETTTEDIALQYKDYPLNPASKAENILITRGDGKTHGAILDPAKTEVQDYIVKVCEELMENYDIDGIHFDDYFYQNLNETSSILLDDIDQAEYELYCDETGKYQKDSETDKADWRRENVNNLIYKLHNAINKYNNNYNKSVQFGISPTSVYKSGDGSVESGSNTRSGGHYGASLFCDTYYWIKQGWIDYIMPQLYCSFKKENIPFADIATWWDKACEGTNVNLYFGIGISTARNEDGGSWYTQEDELLNQLLYIQQLKNVKGVCFFSLYYVKEAHYNEEYKAHNAMIELKEHYWTKQAKVPDTMAEK